MQIFVLFIVAVIATVLTWTLKPVPQSIKSVKKYQWPEEWDLIEISPDGKKLAYTEGVNFHVRHFNSFEPAKIETDEIVQTPLAWSPKSDQIAFYINSSNNIPITDCCLKNE